VSSATPLAAKGFRPFFLLAAAFAVSILPLWMLAYGGAINLNGYLDATHWHAHEMLFGFATAVIAGFLLTAVGNWTGRETATGLPLIGLCAIWLFGRVTLVASGTFPPWLTAISDLAFLPALGVAIGRPLVASKNRRNLVMLGVLAALWLANLTMHLDALGVLPGWRGRGTAVALDVVLLLILVIAGRTFPMFTRNATGVASIRSLPALDALTLISMAMVTVCDAAIARRELLAAAAGLTSVLAVFRARHWGTRHTFKVPLLWILHAGYLWIPLGMALRTVSLFSAAVPSSVATHALTLGAIGSLTLGMMSRVALGHTGRTLTASRAVSASFVLVTLAAIARVLVPLVDVAHYRESVFMAGSLWTAAFAVHLAVYVPILVSPRPDLKPG
jgi:uncharacterized protein involved in response to NO